VVNQAIHRGERHRLIRKNLSPSAKGLIGRYQERATLVPGADEFKDDAGFGLILADIGEIIRISR
jgi:hypothetical protein